MADGKKVGLQKELNKLYAAGKITLNEAKIITEAIEQGLIKTNMALLENVEIQNRITAETKKQAEYQKRVESGQEDLNKLLELQADLVGEMQGDLKDNIKNFKTIGDRNKAITADITKQVQLMVKRGKLTKKEANAIIAEAKATQQIADNLQTAAKTGFLDQLAKAEGAIMGLRTGFSDITSAAGDTSSEFMTLLASMTSITGILALAVTAFADVENSAREIAESTGLGVTYQIQQVEAARELVKSGKVQLATSDEILAIQSAITQELKLGSMVSSEIAGELADTASAFGISNQLASDFASTLLSTGLEMSEIADVTREFNVDSLKAGLNNVEAMKDVVVNGKKASMFFKGNTKQLLASAKALQQMGANLDFANNMAEGLLDFETSIAGQFELQALTGKNINTDLARQMVLEGDIEGATREIMNQMDAIGGYSEQDFHSKKAVQKMLGLTNDELLEQETRNNLINKGMGKQLALADQLGVSAEKLAAMSDAEIETTLKNAQATKDMGQMMESLKLELFEVLGPLGGEFLTYLKDNKGEIQSMVRGLGDAAKAIGNMVTNIMKFVNVIPGGLSTVLAIGVGMKGINGLAKTGKNLFGALNSAKGLFNKSTETALQYSQQELDMLSSYGIGMEENIGKQGRLNTLLDGARSLGTGIVDGLSNIAGAIGKGIASAGKFLFKLIGQAYASLASATGSLITFLGPAGIALAAAAGVGITALIMKAKSVGDLAMGANGGPIVMSPREGTIFQGTKNDELAMGPGVVKSAANTGTASTSTDMTSVVAAINELKNVITQMPAPVVKMDSNIVSETVYATNSYKKR